jgi:hypothetical protein
VRRRVALALGVSLLAVPCADARTQLGAFGQNKIQYRSFDWHVLKGEHVDVYFYPAEERIARVALSYAEQSYAYLETRFNHRVRARIPLIVYASHSDFEQTNVLPFVPPEGVLGVTEYLKRRVTLPFRGSYAEFRHTLRHELVHVFQLSLENEQYELYPRARRPAVPLWFGEGLAEYFSSDQDSRDEMIVRDLTLSGAMPSISQLALVTSPLAYPVGGELLRFLGRRYGDWRINLLYASLWKYDSFDQALAGTYGRSTRELTEEWQYDLRQRHFPAVKDRRPLALAARELSQVAVKPVPVPRADSGIDVAYLSPRSGYTDIYTRPLDGPSRPRTVVKGERTPEFESLHAFSSRLDARDGVLLFASKSGDRDALILWDVRKGRVTGRYRFPELVGIVSPAWSPDGKRVAFGGLTNGGVSDLYVLDLTDGSLEQVTDDPYEDSDPTWLPGGSALVFSSDRAAGGEEGARNLYKVSLGDARVASDRDRARGDGAVPRPGSASYPVPLTAGRWIDEAPRWDADSGRVIFSSDRGGTFDLYSVDTLGNGRRETRVEGGVFDPAPVPGDARVVVSGFTGLSWSVFALHPDSAARRDTFALTLPDSSGRWGWAELGDATAAAVPAARYRRKLALDFAAGGSSTAPGAYMAQGAQLYFSDLLGDQSVTIAAAVFGNGRFDELFDNFNADVFYLNQRRRLNWGLGGFRLAGSFFAGAFDYRQVYRETSSGGYGVLRYPFSRFMRVEAQTRVEYSDRNDYSNFLVRGSPERRGVLVSNFVSLVGDNALWLDTGPIDGTRWNLTGGVVSDASHGAFENWVGTADVRRYVRTTLQSALAFRAYGYASEGTRPRAVQIGGSWLLRGYPRFSLDGTRAWLLNSEWRFPVTNYVTVGFPFGPLRFPQVQGAAFGDLGQAWYDGGYDPRVLGSAGVGFRMALVPGFVLRLDVGRRYSLNGRPAPEGAASNDAYTRRFVDLFFGYNY